MVEIPMLRMGCSTFCIASFVHRRWRDGALVAHASTGGSPEGIGTETAVAALSGVARAAMVF